MKRCAILICIGILTATLTTPLPGAGETRREIIVSAAASLNNAMHSMGRAFEAQHPDTKIVFNFASSGSLLQQMIHGAPVDVFASANQKFMDKAEENGLLQKASRKNFARNTLVLALPRNAALPIKNMEDLKSPTVKRISIGNPASVPAGRYARESLTGYGLWEALAPKLVYANSVRQVLDYISRGEIDAGMVYATDAKIAEEKVQAVLTAGHHRPIIYPIAVLSASRNAEPAQRFVDFVLSAKGQVVLAGFGFTAP